MGNISLIRVDIQNNQARGSVVVAVMLNLGIAMLWLLPSDNYLEYRTVRLECVVMVLYRLVE